MAKVRNLKWTRLTGVLDPKRGSPCARSSHGVSLLVKQDSLMVYGGEHIARTPIEAEACGIWICQNISSSSLSPTWKWVDCSKNGPAGSSPPSRIAHAQAVYQDRYVYIFGGRAGITMDEKAMNDLWVLDTETYTWTEVLVASPPQSIPEARSFHRMICIGQCLYMFGGCGAEHGRLSDLHRFDIPNKTWSSLGSSTLLRGRGGPNLLPMDSGKKIAVVAGFAGEETSDGHMFDVASAKWDDESLNAKLDGMRPRSVCVSESFPLMGLSLIFGGEVDPSDRGHEGAGGFENDLVILDESTGALRDTMKLNKDSDIPEQRGWSAAAAVDDGDGKGRLFVFGGLSGDDANPRRLDDLWRLDVSVAP